MARYVKEVRRDCLAEKGDDLEKGREKPKELLKWWVENLLVETKDSEELARKRREVITEPILGMIKV